MRWYSPRDYIEEEVVDEKGNIVIKGELSARMKIPSNMWVEAWETAKPVPARRQKRLFDDTREAEKVKSSVASDSLIRNACTKLYGSPFFFLLQDLNIDVSLRYILGITKLFLYTA